MIIKADGMFFLIIVIASLLVGPRARHFTQPDPGAPRRAAVPWDRRFPVDLLVCLFTNLV